MKTLPFTVSLLNLIVPDVSVPIISEENKLSQFHFLFNSLPYSLSKKCFTSAGASS